MVAERAHPESDAFKDRWSICWRKRIVPWPTLWKNPWRRAFFRRYRHCEKYVVGKRVLDVPCGVGWGTSLLKRTASLNGMDICPSSIQYARDHYPKKAKFDVGNMTALPYEESAFDVVLCLEGIEHIPRDDARKFVQEAARVLTARGIIIVTSPLPDGSVITNPHHCYEYTSTELDDLLSSACSSDELFVSDLGEDDITYYVGHRR